MELIKYRFAGYRLPPQLGKAPYLWSLFLLFFVWKYFYAPLAPLELACAAVTVGLFLPLYFCSFSMRNGRLAPFIAATVAIGALWVPHNPGASTFFIFATGMCAGIDTRRAAYAALAAVLSSVVLLALLFDIGVGVLAPALIVGIPVGIVAIMDADLRRSRERLLRKQEEVEHLATIAERERISRDLHDLLGHTLSLITLKAELAGKLLGRDAVACGQEIRDIETSARHALGEVRAAIGGYRQTGLTQELVNARAALSAAGVELSVDMRAFAMPAAAESVLALALREAVTNIVRHAGATHCSVTVALEQTVMVLRVEDNGKVLADAALIRHGNGLAGMRERATALGGRLALKAGRGTGLTLELRLPTGAAS
jgi:two-component system sensor histidine kinase DesK